MSVAASDASPDERGDKTASPRASSHSGRSKAATKWALAAILLLAFVLRAWNLDWDRGTKLQPDERFWSDVAANVHAPDDWQLDEILDPERSPLNPRVYKDTYVYGTLPLWASEAAAAVLMTEPLGPVVSGLDNLGINLARDEPADQAVGERLRFNTGYDVTLVGRLMSALIDTATVAVVFLLGRELADRATGLLAAFLQALTVLHIQYSHFLGSEPWVAFFVTCTVWGSVRLARGRGGWPTRALTAVALGFAIASKLNGIAAVAAPVMAALVVIGPQLTAVMRRRIEPGVVGRAARRVEPFLVMALLAVVAYRIAQPYDFRAGISLVFNQDFGDDIEYLSDINGGGNWPWVQPLVGRTPLIHPLKQMLIWGMGPGLGVASVFGVGRAAYRFWRGERFWIVPLAVIGAYLALVSLQFYAIVRYLQPSYPIATALAAVGLVSSFRWAQQIAPVKPQLARAARIGVALCVGITVFWGLAFVNGVYNQDNARLAAGDWMLENLPPTSAVSVQEWDDGLPFGQPSDFTFVTLRPFSFGGDSPEHITNLISGLDQVDYVIESSNKFYDALPRTPARYPQTTEYYRTLFDGSLGFELVETFRNQPSLFGITIDDSSAEEAFTLYDHPTVFIWRKTDSFSVDRAYALLNPERARTAINALPREAGANANMLRPDDYVAQQTGSSFAEVHHNDPPSLVAALIWFALLQLVSIAIAPLLLRAAGRAGGAVYGLTKPLAMVVLALPVWLMVSWGWFNFSRGLVLGWLVVLLVLAAASARRFVPDLGSLWRRHRRMILAAEAVFVTVFLFVLALRMGNPDTWHQWRGGEKPMEMAYLTAVTGSTTMPPYDPWLAGGTLNYYYMGWFVLAVPIRLLGFMPDVGFNLGVVTYAAMAAVTVFSTAALLATLARRRSTRPMPVVTTGVLAAVLFLVIGNLDSFRQVLQRRSDGLPLSQFDWWDPTRVNKFVFEQTCGAPGLDPCGFEVTEFPSFTVLFGDLHPHFMAMSFFGLVLAGSIAFIERARQGRTVSTWVLAIGLGIGTGFIRMVHTWDLPTSAALVAGAIVFGWFMAQGPVLWRLRAAVLQLVAAGGAHLVVSAPYRANNQVADSGFHRSESSTNLDDWVAHWGLFLFVGVAYMVHKLWTHRAQLKPAMGAEAALGLASVVVGFFAFHQGVGSVAAWAFAGVVLAVVLLVVELRNNERSTASVVVAASWLLGFAILVFVESFTQNADIGRLNTVFKFWLQVWHLFAVAGAFSVVWLLAPATAQAPAAHNQVVARITQAVKQLRSPQKGFLVGLVLLLVASLSYPVLAIRPRQANRIDTTLGPSLDGQLWFEPGAFPLGVRDFYGSQHEIDPGSDRPIIDWLRANADGRPTIVEAVGGGEYQWWGRVSIHTGLPAVLGWRFHQTQQRPILDGDIGKPGEVNERNADVADFYNTQDPAVIDAFLRAYDVTYVVVGTLENASSNPQTLELFAGSPALTPVFSEGDLVIYEVAKRSLAQASGPIASIGAG